MSIINLGLDSTNKEKIAEVCKALSSVIRLDMLMLLFKEPMGIVSLAQKLNLPASSVSFHIDILIKAGLVSTITKRGKHGQIKLCKSVAKRVNLDLNFCSEKENIFSYNIPIGSYTDIKAIAKPSCGLASEYEIIELADNPSSFFSPRKTEAQIIWFSHGELTYRIPNYFLENLTVTEINFSLELCSEAPFFNNVYPSDVTFYVNQKELTTITLEGDFGGRRGKYTPQWWNPNLTQFGKLYQIKINNSGVFINEKATESDIKIDDLMLSKPPFIEFRFGIKNNATNKGGLNLFGEKFGDFNQNIIMAIKC